MAKREQTGKMSVTIRTFVVEGDHEFPFDMLRYDRCWPHEEHDSAALRFNDTGRRMVRLSTIGNSAPTDARWMSRGWRVIPGEV